MKTNCGQNYVRDSFTELSSDEGLLSGAIVPNLLKSESRFISIAWEFSCGSLTRILPSAVQTYCNTPDRRSWRHLYSKWDRRAVRSSVTNWSFPRAFRCWYMSRRFRYDMSLNMIGRGFDGCLRPTLWLRDISHNWVSTPIFCVASRTILSVSSPLSSSIFVCSRRLYRRPYCSRSSCRSTTSSNFVRKSFTFT